ncbi:hypothetical protein [Butyrivibrio sp. AC2005]|uniref:hypothetical protein n=1 Tax=Butyrivibrio sp. AC2005 TaxID=1280672 RepID=UPI00040154E5|nr:hypothetical protein [Butyrivibrio sp. AC2005]
MDYTILQHFTITDDTTELKLQIEDKKILVIYGSHINSYYIALPDINISCEALSPDEIKRNTFFLSQAGQRSDYAEEICTAIHEFKKERQ